MAESNQNRKFHIFKKPHSLFREKVYLGQNQVIKYEERETKDRMTCGLQKPVRTKTGMNRNSFVIAVHNSSYTPRKEISIHPFFKPLVFRRVLFERKFNVKK